MYAEECSPPQIRGALCDALAGDCFLTSSSQVIPMEDNADNKLQVWTAFGIMVGYAADLAFYKVKDVPGITGLNWRLMMGSACLPAIIVVCFVFMCPESPRWYMSKVCHTKAYKSMCKLRYNKVQAARDIFYMHTLLEAEKASKMLGQNKLSEIFTVPRNRRALQAFEIVIFM